MKFKIGDKVRITSKYANDNYYNKIGEILEIRGEVYILGNIEGEDNPNIRQFIDMNEVGALELVESVKENIKVGYIILDGSITVSFNGNIKTVGSSDYRYHQIIQAINEDDLSKVPDILEPSNSFKDVDGIELVDGVLEVEGKKVPDGITDKVLEFKKNGLPFNPIIEFSKKVMKNPSFNSRNMLFKFLEHNGHPFTKDGNFIAYKKVDSNFKDCHTHTMDNSVGTVVEMDRSEVDDNPKNTCSSGLHVAAYRYAKDFSSGHLVEVEINPEDVVAVPNDYNGEKMRVCKYKVLAVCESKLEDGIYDQDDDYYFSEREEY